MISDSTRGSTTAYAALAIALAALALAGTEMYLAQTRRAEAGAQAERLAAVEQQVKAAAQTADRVDKQMQDLFRQTQTAFTTVGTELQGVKQAIRQLGDQVAGPEPPPPPAAPSPSLKELEEAVAGSRAGSPAGRAHVIVAGDTFDKLAKHYGTTIEALMSANPGVDPRGLKIGQKIRLP